MPQDSASVHLRIYKKISRLLLYAAAQGKPLQLRGNLPNKHKNHKNCVKKKWGLQSAPKIFHKKRKNKRLNKSDVDLALRARAIVRAYHSAVLHFVDNPCGAAVPYSKLALQ